MRFGRFLCLWLILLGVISPFGFRNNANAEEKISLATVEWEPYYGPRLKNQGYISEITRKAFKSVGFDVDIHFMPWKRAMHDARNGYFDGLLGLYYSKEREEWISYTNQIAETRIVFFSLKGKNIKWEKLTDLSAYRIGIDRGYVHTDEFDNATYLKKEPVRNLEINYNKLINGRIDLVAASQSNFLHLISTQHPEGRDLIEIINPPLTVSKIYNGISRKKENYAHIIKEFNRGLWLIKSDGTFDRILKKHGF